jgi:hypothetical protein
MSSESRQQKFDRLFILFTEKVFQKNAQPLEISNDPGDWGNTTNKQNATGQKNRPVAFLQSVATPALLADVIPKDM